MNQMAHTKKTYNNQTGKYSVIFYCYNKYGGKDIVHILISTTNAKTLLHFVFVIIRCIVHIFIMNVEYCAYSIDNGDIKHKS